MRVLIDIVHPAHVHFFRHLIGELRSGGHHVAIVARDKDVTLDLLDGFGLDHLTVGVAGRNSMPAMGRELIGRVRALRRIGRDFGADVVLTRNPAGVQAARLLRVPGVFDTDDGAAAGVHWKAAVPFATHITMPDGLTDDHRGRRIGYPSYKALAYLHPNRFTPDPTVRDELGVAPGERFFIVRLVAMKASHDRNESGMPGDLRSRVIERLSRLGQVFVSTEAGAPTDGVARPLGIAPHRMHDAIAASSLLVGDSQTMAAEAAMLGVPSVRLSSWAGRLHYLGELEDKYGLTFEFPLEAEEAFVAKVDELAGSDHSAEWPERRAVMLADKCDLTAWYRDFVLGLGERAR
jgi:predicted glycosyltransferase